MYRFPVDRDFVIPTGWSVAGQVIARHVYVALCGVMRLLFASHLRRIGSPLRVDRPDSTPLPLIVRRRPRECYVSPGPAGLPFRLNLWAKGVYYGDASPKTLHEAALIVDLWVGACCDLATLQSRFPCLALCEDAWSFARGEEVQARWESFLAGMFTPELDPVVQAAYRRPQLAALFPFTSLNRLCFSRCTGVPYSADLPLICPVGNTRYCVVRPGDFRVKALGQIEVVKPDIVLGTGTAEEAADILVAHLPAGCGAAIAGTAEDLPVLPIL